jgi:hypothetical protein
VTPHWSATSGLPYAAWTLDLRRPETASDLIALLELAAAVLQAGRAERVFDVLETPQPEGFLAERDGPYEDFLQQALPRDRHLRLFALPPGGVATTPAGTLRTPAHVWFERAEDVVDEATVHDVGALLRQLVPDADPGDQRWLMAHVPPVAVHGGIVGVADQGPGPLLTISLPTSLWFPRVYDPRDDEWPWWGNAAAERNAPRLNRFLTDVRAAGEAIGGTWRVADPEDVDPRYAEQVDEAGIRL